LIERGLEPANGRPQDFTDYIVADQIVSQKLGREASLPIQ
jgi:hypothetical protein